MAERAPSRLKLSRIIGAILVIVGIAVAATGVLAVEHQVQGCGTGATSCGPGAFGDAIVLVIAGVVDFVFGLILVVTDEE